MAQISVLNVVKFEGTNGIKAMRKSFNEWKAQGLQVTKIEATGDFLFRGELPFSFDDDDPQEIHMPLGRSYVRLGAKKFSVCPDEGGVFSVSLVATGEEIDEDDESLDTNLLDDHRVMVRKAKVEEEAASDEEDSEDED